MRTLFLAAVLAFECDVDAAIVRGDVATTCGRWPYLSHRTVDGPRFSRIT